MGIYFTFNTETSLDDFIDRVKRKPSIEVEVLPNPKGEPCEATLSYCGNLVTVCTNTKGNVACVTPSDPDYEGNEEIFNVLSEMFVGAEFTLEHTW